MADEMEDRRQDDERLRRLLSERLPKHAPPAHLRAAIVNAVSVHELRATAEASGMGSMFADGQCKVVRRITTLDEVRRVAPPVETEPGVARLHAPFASRRALDPPAPRFVARTPQPAVTASTSPIAATPSDLETAPTPVVAAETSVRSTVFWRVSV